MSNATTTITLQAQFNPQGFNDAKKGVDDLAKYTENVRKNQLFRSGRGEAAAQLNLFRQGSDVFTQGLSGVSPFTILIQQGPQVLDILASGALSAGKFAASLGLVGAGAAGVMLIVDAYQKAAEAQLAAAEASERLAASQKDVAKYILENGVALEQVERARKILLNRSATISGRGTPEAIKEQADIDAALADLRVNGTAVARFEQKAFERTISPEAKKMVQESAINRAAKEMTPESLQAVRADRNQLAQNLEIFARGKTEAEALAANRALESIEKLDKVIAATEEVMRERALAVPKILDDFFGSLDEQSRLANEKTKEVKEKDVKIQRTEAFGPSMTSARQSIGGMANAPILSSFQKQVQLLDGIRRASEQTAQNTARSSPPASPVSDPDPFINLPRNYTRIAGN